MSALTTRAATVGCALALGCARAEADPGAPSEVVAAPSAARPATGSSAPDVSSAAPTATPTATPAAVVPGAPCPPEMARVAVARRGVCVDRFEAGLRELSDGGRAARTHPYFERPRADRRYAATSVAGAFPQAYISRDEAAAACANADKRLCTRSEWQRACRAEGRRVYPYGDARRDGACNSGKPPLLPLLFPERGWHYAYDLHFNAPELAKEPGFLARTGDYAACVSELGVHDMVGNLHEWVSDGVGQAFVAQFEAEMKRQWQPVQLGNGVFMGGFFSTGAEHGAGCAFTTVAHEPGYHDYSTGFRCCRDAR